MTMATRTAYMEPFESALRGTTIKCRAEVRGARLEDLQDSDIEEACLRLEKGLRDVRLVTKQMEAIIRSEIQRAKAYASIVYSDPLVGVRAAYGESVVEEPQVPVFITGLAGVGKTYTRLALRRALGYFHSTLRHGSAHPEVPLFPFAHAAIDQKRGASQVLESLLSDSLPSGKRRMTLEDLTQFCARRLRTNGTCLLAIDETQFMAQSEDATTMVTRTLLSVAALGIPWFVVGNFSLGWKLRRRPAEAQQRLLGRPVVMLPDAADSEDWRNLLLEYQNVFGGAATFDFVQRRTELWNLSAGLKRELVRLLVLSFRLSRTVQAPGMVWDHVVQAFHSAGFSVARGDINALLAHGAQGGELRKDLACPFDGPELRAPLQAYSDQLRQARLERVAQASVLGSMNLVERQAIRQIEKSAETVRHSTAEVIKLPKRRQPRTLESLTAAALNFEASLGRKFDDL